MFINKFLSGCQTYSVLFSVGKNILKSQNGAAAKHNMVLMNYNFVEEDLVFFFVSYFPQKEKTQQKKKDNLKKNSKYGWESAARLYFVRFFLFWGEVI